MKLNWKSCLATMTLFGMSLLCYGCGGGGAGGGSQAPTTFTLSGTTIANGAGLPGVVVTVSGVTAAITSDSTGRFSAELPNGQYAVTPALPGYVFFPESQTMTIANGPVSVPAFTATAAASSFSVSGKVSLAGAGLPGVTVSLSGSGAGSTTSDSNGRYSFSGVRNGGCTVVPSLAGFSFNPLSQALIVSNANVSAQDFTASALSAGASDTFTISGMVSFNGTGLSGVSVSISGAAPGTVFTDPSGGYSFPGLKKGDYIVIPSIAGYSFSPTSSSLSVTNANLGGKNFTATSIAGGSITITF